MNHKQVKLSLVKPWRCIGGVEEELHRVLNSAVDKDEWSNSQPGRFMPGNKTRYEFKRMLDGFQRLSEYFEEKFLLPAVAVPTELSRLPSVPHNGLLGHETRSTFSEKLIVAQLVTVFLTFWGKWRFMSVFPVLKQANPFHTLQP